MYVGDERHFGGGSRAHFARGFEFGATHLVVEVADFLEWARRFERDNRHVARTHFPLMRTTVSTIFLGLDHGFGYGPPLWYETIVFGGPDGGPVYQRRYSTRQQAFHGHLLLCITRGWLREYDDGDE